MTGQTQANTPPLRRIRAKNLLSFGPDGIDLELSALNVLIGPNGSGKSNLFEVIALLHAAPTELASPIRSGGGIRNWLWRREPATTAVVEAIVDYPGRPHPLRHTLEFTESNQRFTVVNENIDNPYPNPGLPGIGFTSRGDEVATDESVLSHWGRPNMIYELAHLERVYRSISLYREWQFGRANKLRGAQNADLRQSPLEPDLVNLGMFLNRLRQEPTTKANLIDRLSDAYEGLTDFELNFQGGSVEVYFTEGDFSIPASRLSDGSLRYLTLLAILLDPEPPRFIGIEEPELGLHPDLIPKMADLLVEASSRSQLLVTTHSDILVDALSHQPESVVVCDKHKGQTSMSRLDRSDLTRWLKRYSLGQLWTKGKLGGVRW